MTSDAKRLLAECEQRGLQLEPRGQMLFVAPEENTTPKIVAQLRRHKLEIIASLEAKQRATWTHVAKQILAGEFDGADNSAVASLTIGLRGVIDPQCQLALARLELEKPDNLKK